MRGRRGKRLTEDRSAGRYGTAGSPLIPSQLFTSSKRGEKRTAGIFFNAILSIFWFMPIREKGKE